MFGESDEIYITTVLGLDRGNTFDGATVLILGGGDGGILNALTSLPKPPRHVLMVEVSLFGMQNFSKQGVSDLARRLSVPVAQRGFQEKL